MYKTQAEAEQALIDFKPEEDCEITAKDLFSLAMYSDLSPVTDYMVSMERTPAQTIRFFKV